MEDNEGLIEGEQARRASSIRFKTVKVDKILYRDQIDPEFMRVPMPESIRKNRNIAIYFNYIQFACCVAALVYYRKRRVLIDTHLIFIGKDRTIRYTHPVCVKFDWHVWYQEGPSVSSIPQLFSIISDPGSLLLLHPH